MRTASQENPSPSLAGEVTTNRVTHERSGWVMQVVDGANSWTHGTGYIGFFLGREGKLDPQELALLSLSVLEGLEYAHRRGVIHRNLSRWQLWFGDEDEPGLKVAGFGGARVLDMVGLTTHSVGRPHHRWVVASRQFDEERGDRTFPSQRSL